VPLQGRPLRLWDGWEIRRRGSTQSINTALTSSDLDEKGVLLRGYLETTGQQLGDLARRPP
jgi:hypothetical protein